MRRGLMVVLGLLAAAAGLTAAPAPVKAQDLPGALIGVITRPLGAILGFLLGGWLVLRFWRPAAS